MYYNPAMTYEPWQTMTGQYANADPNTPRSYALSVSPTFDLSASYDTVSNLGEVIADDQDPAVFSHTGPWSDATDNEAYNNHYYFTAQGNSDVTATWNPYLLAGQYKVYARYKKAADRSDNVPYTITYSGGTQTIIVDQLPFRSINAFMAASGFRSELIPLQPARPM
jgi:hypothetical protein